MTVRRGPSTSLLLSTSPRRTWDGDLNRWQRGGWDYQSRTTLAADWPMAGVDPWAGCSTWRALAESSPGSAGPPVAARFCGNCGAKRGEGFVFCGDCGTRFDAAPAVLDPEATLRSIAAEPARGARLLAQLIDEYGDNAQFTKDARRALTDLLVTDFAGMTVLGPVDGVESTSAAPLTLQAAQDLQEAIARGGDLTSAHVKAAGILVRSAPWTFGYWGPAKALLKSGPGRGLAEAYAIAVARVSMSSWKPEPDDVEPVGFMAGFAAVSSDSTRMYMARRVRRDIKSLADGSPDQYAQVAARILTEWDSALAPGAFAPAYIMLGDHSPLNSHSQYVAVPADMSERRDAHPEVWDAHLDLVRQVFRVIRQSPEAHTWAYQVLAANGHAPAITADTIGLSLRSGYAPLALAAGRALASMPEAFGSLSKDMWTGFFRNADNPSFDAVLDELSALPKVDNAVSAARGILTQQQSLAVERIARLAVLYLAGTPADDHGWRPGGTDAADVAAVLAIAEVYRFEPRQMWEPILKRLSKDCLEQALFQLADRPGMNSAQTLLADALFAKFEGNRFAWLVPDLARRCLQNDAAELVALGWRLVDEFGGLTEYLPRLTAWLDSSEASPAAALHIVQGALARAEGPQVTDVLTVALGSRHPGLDPVTVAGLILATHGGAAMLWAALGASDVSEALAVTTATASTITAVGGAVIAPQIVSAGLNQLQFLRTYLRDNPDRIDADPEFGLAVSSCLDPELQQMALQYLAAGGHVPRVWLQLAESAMPACLSVAAAYVESRRQPQELMDAVLACLDSQVAVVRDLGMRILEERQPMLEDPQLWVALSESDEPLVQRLVAEEALARGWVDETGLAGFDRRVLTARRRNRPAKEAIKVRLASSDDVSGVIVQPERIRALLDMARGSNDRDRSWALSRLATLHLSGVEIPELNVSGTTSGGAT
jgi:hypothetical protein